MSLISLLPVGKVGRALLVPLSEGLAQRLRTACSIQSAGLNVDFAFNPARRQYHSTEILKKLLDGRAPEAAKVLAVTELDLYIPVLTFVFGEAHLEDGRAVVSTHRLRQEFYGLPSHPALLAARLLKESLHELGHTYGLRHCADYRCVMSSSNAVERIDLKEAEFCPNCQPAVGLGSNW